MKSLIEFDVQMYESEQDCALCKEKVPQEHVRF